MNDIIKTIQTNYRQSKQKCIIPVIDGDYTSHTLYQHGSLAYNSTTGRLMIYTESGGDEDGVWRVIS